MYIHDRRLTGPRIDGSSSRLDSYSGEFLGEPATRSLPPLGTFARVEHEANKVIANSVAAKRWGVTGSLQPSDIKIEHPGPEIANFFPRKSLAGYGKSNVFALDIAWRSGFHVPLLNIGSDDKPEFIYPLSNMLTTFAERAIRSNNVLFTSTGFCSNNITWGSASTVLDTDEIHYRIKGKTKGGSGMFILVGWRRSGYGHVGIIRRIINRVDDKNGSLIDITYEGFEATTDGARVVKWRWNTTQCDKVTGPCPAVQRTQSLQNFCAIHIIGLKPQAILCNRGVVVEKTELCKLV